MQNFLHFLEEQTPKKIKKKCCQKFNSKWPLYSRWRPKLNLLVKTTNHLFSKKNFRAVLIAKIPKFYRKKKFSKIQDGAYIQHGDFFWHLFLRAVIFVRNFKMVKFLHFLKEQTPKKIKKIVAKKLNSKWSLNSRLLPKLILLM
jgi:hypothetical protein